MAEVRFLDIGKGMPEFSVPSSGEVEELFPFRSMRKHQSSTVSSIIGAFESGYKHVILEAPTGFGKSPVAVALSKHFGGNDKSSYIMVSSKYLQDQYVNDFNGVTVKGRANFQCLRGGTCASPSRRLSRCKHIPVSSGKNKKVVGLSAKRGRLYLPEGTKMCPYWKQKCEAMEHPCPIFNYDYFLHETKFAGDFGKRDLMVCDEAHSIESKLMSFIGFEIYSNELNKAGARYPDSEVKMETWQSLMEEWRDIFQKKAEKLEEKRFLSQKDTETLEDYRNKVWKCDFLADELDTNPEIWVVSDRIHYYKGRPFKKFVFKPIKVSKWNDMLFSKGEHFLLQSATIINPDTLCDSLGIGGEVLYIKVPSTFPVDKRPFVFRGVGKMSRSSISGTLPLLLREVGRIMEENPDQKGVIHTHSYSIMREITQRRSDRFIFNDSGFSRDQVFEEFKDSGKPLVLVTPSAFEGVDFKDDFCRWQVLCKVPYPDLGDPQVKKRAESDPEWYRWLTALRIVQTYGRGMRSEHDHCRTYILDSKFQDFYHQNRQLFPEWFKDAIMWNVRV